MGNNSFRLIVGSYYFFIIKEACCFYNFDLTLTGYSLFIIKVDLSSTFLWKFVDCLVFMKDSLWEIMNIICMII